MKRWFFLGLVCCGALLSLAGAVRVLAADVAHAECVACLPIVANVGQFPTAVAYQLRDGDTTYWFTPKGIWQSHIDSATGQVTNQFMPLATNNLPRRIQPLHPLTRQLAYFGPATAVPHAPTWGGLRYVDVLPGVDLLIETSNGRLHTHLSSSPLSTFNFQLSTLHSPLSTLHYSTFLGGTFSDEIYNIAVDEAGRVYLTGYTQSPSFPTNTLPLNDQHGVDVFVAKLAPDGTNADYVLWINAASLFDEDYGNAIAIDHQGHAFVTGHTRSADFCAFFGLGTPGLDKSYNANDDAFALKIKPDGSGVEYCTFLGGSDADIGRAIAVDSAGNALIAGGTWSNNITTTVDAYDPALNDLRDGFLMKLDPSGTQLLYSTYFGAIGQEEFRSMVLDAANNIYLAGWSNSADLPTTPQAYQMSNAGGFDGFLVKFLPNGQPDYLSYLGGASEDRALSVALDQTQEGVYVAGYTLSDDFPHTNTAYDPSYNGGYDGFWLKLNAHGTALLAGSFLGGTGDDFNYGLSVDETEAVYLAGQTNSTDFPTTTLAFQPTLAGGDDAYVVQLAGSNLLYGSYLGGVDNEVANTVVGRNNGMAFLGGKTLSANFPVTPGSYDDTPNGDYDGFVVAMNVPQTAVAPTELFLTGPLTGSLHTPHTFTATVAPITTTLLTYIWQATAQSPFTQTNAFSSTAVFQWDTAGLQTITVTAQNVAGSVTASRVFTVSTAVSADFSASPLSGPVPLTVTFTNTAGGDFDTLLWDFGDTTTSTLPNPTHVYTTPGSYTVTLTVSGLGGTASLSQPGYILAQPNWLYLPLITQSPVLQAP